MSFLSIITDVTQTIQVFLQIDQSGVPKALKTTSTRFFTGQLMNMLCTSHLKAVFDHPTMSIKFPAIHGLSQNSILVICSNLPVMLIHVKPVIWMNRFDLTLMLTRLGTTNSTLVFCCCQVSLTSGKS